MNRKPKTSAPSPHQASAALPTAQDPMADDTSLKPAVARRRVGRPARSPEGSATDRIQMRATADECRKLADKARAQGLNLSDFLRAAAAAYSAKQDGDTLAPFNFDTFDWGEHVCSSCGGSCDGWSGWMNGYENDDGMPIYQSPDPDDELGK